MGFSFFFFSSRVDLGHGRTAIPFSLYPTSILEVAKYYMGLATATERAKQIKPHLNFLLVKAFRKPMY